ncbi:hypothetical protein SMSP2_01144 [Limihaloglobus sulfuriphilus]|uniref:DUF985 domain-containing protein n=1 Tax=Limihaloglobus sulfuriphilus TaxID=1851148 RepID=A0A1Q2MDK6_9BACT|nr:cupin domain-containing protein [Limihaloglobus sulfuriphilus]AQQ70783.1 hypothetical protein SMSP2_01144 [Limihaloglobus sulfuriphilus]
MNITAKDIIQRFKLQAHPEGGYFTETYRSGLAFDNPAVKNTYKTQHCAGTAIYYLLTSGTFSAMHRVASDEIFHFYLGDAVEMLQLLPDGSGKNISIGTDINTGQQPQVLVPAGSWQGCRLAEGGKFALMGCTVAPGFEFEDFQMADREQLIRKYPDFKKDILQLTK